MKYIFFLLFVSSSLFAAKQNQLSPWLTWHNDPNTTMVIHWITTPQSADSTLSYARKSKRKPEWSSAVVTHKNLPHAEPHVLHTVELQNLLPDTKYQFRIGKNKRVHLFRTMPLNLTTPIRFVVGADAKGTHEKRFRTMCKKAAAQNPRFAIIGGDIAYSVANSSCVSEDFSRWESFFRCWSAEMRDTSGCIIPLFVAIGNHEVFGGHNRTERDAPLYYAFFQKACYDFGFGDYAHFTFLDSGHTHPIKGKQTEWLKQTLKEHSHFLHRFAVYHVGAYPSTRAFDEPARKAIRKYWVPLFEKYRIHACFEGHDHAYKRTYPLRRGKTHPEGILYIGDGAWGVKPREPSQRAYIATSKASQQVLIVELSYQTRTFWAIDPEGQCIDLF